MNTPPFSSQKNKKTGPCKSTFTGTTGQWSTHSNLFHELKLTLIHILLHLLLSKEEDPNIYDLLQHFGKHLTDLILSVGDLQTRKDRWTAIFLGLIKTQSFLSTLTGLPRDFNKIGRECVLVRE